MIRGRSGDYGLFWRPLMIKDYSGSLMIVDHSGGFW